MQIAAPPLVRTRTLLRLLPTRRPAAPSQCWAPAITVPSRLPNRSRSTEPAAAASTLPGTEEGIYVDAGTNANIVIRNLSIDGGGTGSDAIFVASTGTTNVVNVLVDGCLVSGFSDYGIALGSESPMYLTVRTPASRMGRWAFAPFRNRTISAGNQLRPCADWITSPSRGH